MCVCRLMHARSSGNAPLHRCIRDRFARSLPPAQPYRPCARAQVSGLSELTSRTVRDRLARLSQMSLLLGLESAEELLDYWGGGGGGGGGGEGGSAMNWRLTAGEARAVLGLRVDFSKDAINALPL